ncbi:MAG: hypothetical protein FJX57_05725 [Alphaproteobacteria bacterium]|nr:hypothetical protein [Alphaproteobacteria bacterium]
MSLKAAVSLWSERDRGWDKARDKPAKSCPTAPVLEAPWWDKEMATLVAWFQATPPPPGPLPINPAVTVIHTELYWKKLAGDIAAGPRGPRMRYAGGALRHDLRRLRELLENPITPK